MIDMAKKQILPVVNGYVRQLAETVNAVKAAGVTDASVQVEMLKEVSGKLEEARAAELALEKVLSQVSAIRSEKEKAFFYKDQVFVAMTALRTPVDALEMLVDKSVWPMPTYGDLIFEV